MEGVESFGVEVGGWDVMCEDLLSYFVECDEWMRVWVEVVIGGGDIDWVN